MTAPAKEDESVSIVFENSTASVILWKERSLG